VRGPLSVLIIAQYFPPDLGGSATRAYNVAKGLLLNGCRVTVVAAFPHYPHGNIPTEYRWKPFKEELKDEIRVIRTFMPPIKSVGLFRRLVLMGCFAVSSLFVFPKVKNMDVIWASSWTPGIIYSRLKRRPLALNVDDLILEDVIDLGLMGNDSLIIKLAERIYKVLLRKGNAVTPVSPGYVDVLSKNYGVNEGNIHVVLGGVDTRLFRSSNPSLNNGKFTVLYSGAFSVAYDFDQIFSAAEIVEKEGGGVDFVIQGGGELAMYLETKVKGLNLRNVGVINEIVSREEVAELLKGANALILPLKDLGKPYLGMSSKIYEYQAAGRPIICCAEGMPAEYVKESRSGLVVKPGDYKALAKSVLYLKKNQSILKELGENGRQYVENTVSLKKIGSVIKQLLLEL
jgi:glycosyltransferase involved in cell wall biosynthesis